MTGPRDRRRATALQQALERYERMLAEGAEPAEARRRIASDLGLDARVFALATAMREKGDGHIPGPDPAFAAALARRLSTTTFESRLAPRPARPRLGFVPLAAAACIAIFALLLVPSLRSLPGDRLYGVKSFSEDARLLFATGSTEARVRLDLADERFSEVERLMNRASTHAVGLTAQGVLDDISDPEIAELIEGALSEAGQHLEKAADILTAHPSDAGDLDELVKVSKRGHALATQVADDLPVLEQTPVLSTVVKLAKIEAAAKAARTQVDSPATPPPCATPTPTPEPTELPDGEGEQTETATSTAVESPTAEPTDTPEPTPCISPSPELTPEPTPTVEPTSEPSEPPDVEEGGSDSSDEAGVSSDGESDQQAVAQPAHA